MKNIIDVIGTLQSSYDSISITDEGSLQYFKAIETTREKLQKLLPEPNEEVSSEYPLNMINASITMLEGISRNVKFSIQLWLAEFLQSLVNRCNFSDFPIELQQKLLGKEEKHQTSGLN